MVMRVRREKGKSDGRELVNQNFNMTKLCPVLSEMITVALHRYLYIARGIILKFNRDEK